MLSLSDRLPVPTAIDQVLRGGDYRQSDVVEVFGAEMDVVLPCKLALRSVKSKLATKVKQRGFIGLS